MAPTNQPTTEENNGTPVALGRGRVLSPMQRALLASHLAHPDHPAQSMALVSHLDAPIDADRLAEAFARVVAGNDVLRTRVGEADGGPVDGVDLIDVDDLPTSEILSLDRHEVPTWAQRRAEQPLRPDRLCWDSAIAIHPDGTASWYLNLHHIVTDATSSALVFEATAAAYHGTTRPGSSYYEWARRLDRVLDRTTAGDGPAGRALAHWRDRPAAPPPGSAVPGSRPARAGRPSGPPRTRPTGRPGPPAAVRRPPHADRGPGLVDPADHHGRPLGPSGHRRRPVRHRPAGPSSSRPRDQGPGGTDRRGLPRGRGDRSRRHRANAPSPDWSLGADHPVERRPRHRATG